MSTSDTTVPHHVSDLNDAASAMIERRRAAGRCWACDQPLTGQHDATCPEAAPQTTPKNDFATKRKEWDFPMSWTCRCGRKFDVYDSYARHRAKCDLLPRKANNAR